MIKQTLSLFNFKIKLEIFFLFILNWVTALLEVVSIGSIPVFLAYAMNPESILTKIPLENIRFFLSNFFDSTNYYNNLKSILIIIMLIFIIKNFLTVFNSVYQAFFNRKIQTFLTSRLFNQYLSENYLFFIDNKPSELIKNIESVGIARSVISITLSGFREILIVLGLIVLIGYTNYKIALVLIILGIIFIIFHKLKISKILKSYGKKSYIFQENRLSLINEFFGSIVDIKITNKENFFSKLFRHYIWSYESTKIVDKIISTSVRPVVELLGVFIMISMILFISSQGKTFYEIIPLITLLSLSFIRIIPSGVMLINYSNRLKFESSQLKYLTRNIILKKSDVFEQEQRKTIKFNKKIEIKDLNFSYPKNININLSNINLTINKGDNIGLIGKTGSGKSTLMNNISNLIKFDKGQIIFDNEIIVNPKENFRIENLYYIRQNVYLLNDTILNNVAFGEENKNVDIKHVEDCLISAGLEKYINKLDLIIGNKGSKISGGENQLLGFARALYRKPDMLFLDEPTSNLDYKNEKNYFNVIKELNITSLLIAHRVKTLDYCNKIILIEDGKIIDQGNVNYFKEKYKNFTNYIN